MSYKQKRISLYSVYKPFGRVSGTLLREGKRRDGLKVRLVQHRSTIPQDQYRVWRQHMDLDGLHPNKWITVFLTHNPEQGEYAFDKELQKENPIVAKIIQKSRLK